MYIYTKIITRKVRSVSTLLNFAIFFFWFHCYNIIYQHYTFASAHVVVFLLRFVIINIAAVFPLPPDRYR